MSAERDKQLLAFLLGEGELDGCWFGDDTHPQFHGRYWWRKDLAALQTRLREALAQSPEDAEWLRKLAKSYLSDDPVVLAELARLEAIANRLSGVRE